MPEIVNDRQIFSLLEVTRSIQKTLAERYKSSFWVKAEMNKLNHYPQSGHCYPELVEKKEGKIIAEIRSNLWKDDFHRINDNFLSVLKEPLKNGINILFCAKVSYDPIYGLSLRIIDIDPSYSLGELEREKQETIEKLKQEGIFNLNKSLNIALLPKRIAIISVQTSKGYSDFLKIINGNVWSYKYFIMLFPALLQGEKAVESIIKQLNSIKKVKHHFDAVAIIRGGGGDVGLTCYNNYLLSKEIALFPIPIITGIGHSTNETVAEMIAFKNAITPTELADFLLQKFHNYSVPVQKAQETIVDKSKRLILEEKLKLYNSVRYFKSVTGAMLIKSNHTIQNELKTLLFECVYFFKRTKENHLSLIAQLNKDTKHLITIYNQNMELAKVKLFDKTSLLIKSENQLINNIEKNIELMNPYNVLKRGYSITTINGRDLKKLKDIKEGDEIRTIISEGNIISTVKQKYLKTYE